MIYYKYYSRMLRLFANTEKRLSQIPIAPPPLRSGDDLQCFPGRRLTIEDLHHLLPVGADPSPVAHQAHGPEQIPLDHEAVEAPDALLWVDRVQHEMVLDRRSSGKGARPFSVEPKPAGVKAVASSASAHRGPRQHSAIWSHPSSPQTHCHTRPKKPQGGSYRMLEP